MDYIKFLLNEELKNFSTFRNPNNFDNYYSKVLPTSII